MSKRSNAQKGNATRATTGPALVVHSEGVNGTGERFQHDYRPAVYWAVPDAVFANIKGARRRRIIREAIARGELESVPAEMLGDDLPAELRSYIGAIHPSFMGGEYLPANKACEVEIARVTLPETVTCDVFSIRARPVPGGIAYRVVDECDTVFDCPAEQSKLPLTLGELIQLIDTTSNTDCEYSGLVVGMWDYRVSGCGEAPSDRLEAEVTSDYYPQLEAWYEGVAKRWDKRHGVIPLEERPDEQRLASIRTSLLANLAWDDRRTGTRRTKAQRDALVQGWIAMRWG